MTFGERLKTAREAAGLTQKHEKLPPTSKEAVTQERVLAWIKAAKSK
jgi:transcriptional regulator with XRE-family HTH domain